MKRLVCALAGVTLAATACSSAQDESEPSAEARQAVTPDDLPQPAPVDESVKDEATDVAAAADREGATSAPQGRIVDCLIVTNGEDYQGPCRFVPDTGGSFSLMLDDESSLVDEITLVSVTVIQPGEADVRGLTTDGINSRWGWAQRDASDRACWNGSDFKICAY